MNILIFGPQASGKGTQAEMIAKKYAIKHLSIGDVFRHEVAEQTKMGKQLEEYMNRGELVPQELNNKIVLDLLQKHPDGVILDGYPRNIDQAKFLDEHWHLEKVIVLEVPDNVCIERISGRRVCDNGHDYHVLYKKPKKEGLCDIDNLPLHMRDDDKPEAIKKRLSIYHEQTEPILEHYNDKIVRVNGNQDIAAVFEETVKKM